MTRNHGSGHVTSTLDADLKAGLTLIIRQIIILLSFTQQVILIVDLWLVSHGEPPGPRSVSNLWSNQLERTLGNEKRQIEDSSYSKAIEGLLRATARKNYPNSETSTIPCLHLQILTFVNPEKSWSSKTETFGYDKQICLGTYSSS